MEESESEEDCERSLSRREVDELIDSIIENPTASRKSGSRGSGGEGLCCTPDNCCNLPMLNFELKTQGCMPRTRNQNQS